MPLLSATPYRAVTLHHETDDDHYGDFLKLLGFLEDGDAAGCKEILAEYRAALPSVVTNEGMLRLRNAKAALQRRLVRVMARTERLSSSKMRDGTLSRSTVDVAHRIGREAAVELIFVAISGEALPSTWALFRTWRPASCRFPLDQLR